MLSPTRKVYQTKNGGALSIASSQKDESLSNQEHNKTDDKIYPPPSNCKVTNNGLFMPVEIDNVQTLGLIDTGSEISIINDKFVSDCKRKVIEEGGTVGICQWQN
jgi:hypothetical protein